MMADCEKSAQYWKKNHGLVLRPLAGKGRQCRNWKALAIIENAYAEYGRGLQARKALQDLGTCSAKDVLATAISDTAEALAADRSTKSVIVIVVGCIFILSVAVALFRTAAAADSPATSNTIFINVEAHSIAFSAMFFWMLPTVILGSIIGVSQTEAARPNILKRFKKDLERSGLLTEGTHLQIDILNEELSDTEARVFNKGIPSWRPSRQQDNLPLPAQLRPSEQSENVQKTGENLEKRQTKKEENCVVDDLEAVVVPNVVAVSEPLSCSSGWLAHRSILAHTIVILGSAAGMTISALVPPDGFDCRHICQLAILSIWLASASSNIVLDKVFPLTRDVESRNRKSVFRFTLIKDLLAASSTVGTILATQVGIFNSCSCYTRWGSRGLQLPEMPDVAAILRSRLSREYPLIAFSAMGIELVIVPLVVWLWYRDAMRVFVQRDDGESNQKTFREMGKALRHFRCRLTRILSHCWPKKRV
ncbi:hypothetical protein ACLMJK_001173 [Lecanora helva]